MKLNLLIPFALLVFTSCHSNGQQKTKTASQPTHVTLLAKEIVQDIPDKHYDGLRPADLAPDVVTIDADEIRQLINGVCIVVKGNQMEKETLS